MVKFRKVRRLPAKALISQRIDWSEAAELLTSGDWFKFEGIENLASFRASFCRAATARGLAAETETRNGELYGRWIEVEDSQGAG